MKKIIAFIFVFSLFAAFINTSFSFSDTISGIKKTVDNSTGLIRSKRRCGGCRSFM